MKFRRGSGERHQGTSEAREEGRGEQTPVHKTKFVFTAGRGQGGTSSKYSGGEERGGWI